MSWLWIVTIAAVVGNVLNIYRSRWCFVVWALTNVCFFTHNVMIGEYAQAALFMVYFGLSVWGWVAWCPWK